MPRTARRMSATGFYHIILRGVNRQDIFFDDQDRTKMLQCFAQYSKEAGVTISAYCLMDNHIHLLISTPESIDTFVKKIAASYVFYFNKKYGRVGHLFQERFLSEPVETRAYLLTVFRYILQNPQKANKCKLYEYPWSSWREFDGENGICQMNRVAELAGGLDALRDFVLAQNNDSCLDLNGYPKYSEQEALRIAERILGGLPVTAITRFPKDRRREFYCQMLAAGLSQVQIARLTGQCQSVISRTVRAGKATNASKKATSSAGKAANAIEKVANSAGKVANAAEKATSSADKATNAKATQQTPQRGSSGKIDNSKTIATTARSSCPQLCYTRLLPPSTMKMLPVVYGANSVQMV